MGAFDMIPRIIHQVWIGKKNKKPQRLMDTWRDMNPSCEYMEWTEEELIQEDFELHQQIRDMQYVHGKVTVLRYELLYKYGGFMVDADSECILPLDDFFFEDDRFSCYENEEMGIYGGIKLVSAGYMAAQKHDGLMKECVKELKTRRVKNFKSHCVAGNLFFATMIERYKEQYPMVIYPSHFFIPKHGTGLEYDGDGKVYAKQYWGSTFGIYNTL